MKRLTEQYNGEWVTEHAEEIDYFLIKGKAIDRLAVYEDTGLTPEQAQELAKAKAEDRLVVLPVKVGDTVYEPFAGKVYEKTVDRIIINRFTTPQIWIETKLPFAAPRLERWDMAFGKTVFLTREEAEKAIGGETERGKEG